jgi:hypothetical protein
LFVLFSALIQPAAYGIFLQQRSTGDATDVLPRPHICIGNQERGIISQILHQAAARKVINLVYCLKLGLRTDDLALKPTTHSFLSSIC